MKKLSSLFLMTFIALFSYSQEICDNGVDDDGDGQIDLNDTECNCTGFNNISLIPNPSFEIMDTCPTSYSQVFHATGWSQANSATTDYFNCNFSFEAADSAGLMPYPNGNGIMGAIFSSGWQEYLGACLTQPIIANQMYVLELTIASTPINGQGNLCNGGVLFYDSIDITLFGSPICETFPLDSTNCPSNLAVIGSVSYLPTSSWSTISMLVSSSVDINTIVLGSPCILPAGYDIYNTGGCYPYFYFDNLILNAPDSNLYQIDILPTGSFCSNSMSLEAFSDTLGGRFQWYYEGVAIVNDTLSILDVSATVNAAGTYQVVQTIGNDCQTTSYFLAIINDCTGQVEFDQTELFNIYPNPANNLIFVRKEGSFSNKMEIDILSIDGKIIKQVSYPEFVDVVSIDINDLSSGLYFMKVKYPFGTSIKPFVKK